MSMKINLLRMKEYGEVTEIKQDIANISGLSNCMNGQLVNFEGGSRGVIVGFDAEAIMVLVISGDVKVKPGDKVFATIDSFTVGVGPGFVGRTINGLGQPIDGGPRINILKQYPIFNNAPSVLDRVPLDEALETGIKILDITNPIGKGQRQLILGDRVTGKTTIGTDTILNQQGKGVICIYCCIGKAETSLSKVVEIFASRPGVLDYTIIVSATASSSVGQQYLAPYIASSIGEYFVREEHRDVFVVFDDLTKHAWVYRQMSLLLGRSPGRDAYPGDIFYIHSQLVERAGRLKPELGNGSMTFFPVVETVQGDLTSYISTNLISMTDGQLFVSTPLFSEGFKPAIDIGLSVSRIGSKVQWPAMRKLAGILRLEYIQYKELEKLTRIKAGVSEIVEKRLRKGRVVSEILKQDNERPVPMEDQIMVLYALSVGAMDQLMPDQVRDYQRGLIAQIRAKRPDAVQELVHKKDLTPMVKEGFDEQVAAYGQGRV